MKLCKDCRFCKKDYCFYFNHMKGFCKDMRSSSEFCGEDAFWFQPKASLLSKIKSWLKRGG